MNSKLRTILTKVDHTKTADNPDGNPFMPGNLSVDEAEKAIRKAVAEDMLELVGEDDKVTGHLRPNGHPSIDLTESYRNEFRAELRQKIKEYGGLK